MKRKHVIGIIVIVLLVAAVFTGRYIYKERYSDEMKKSLVITNGATTKFKAIGIAWKNNVVLQKTNKKDYFIPKILEIEESKVRLVALTEDNKLLKSDEFLFEQKLVDPDKPREVTIKNVMNQKLILNVVTGKSDIKVLKMPKEYKWEYTDRITGGNQFIKVLFKAKTKYAYEVTLHGKGGKHGYSGKTEGGKEAVVEWDQPADNLQNSWVRLIKK